MTANRADPLDDISDFTPSKLVRPKPPIAAVRKVTAENGFTGSRTPPAAPPRSVQRRHRTGRNVQLNLKVTATTLARFTALADRKNWLFAETLERALDALEKKGGGENARSI